MDTLNETLSKDVITSDRVEGTTVYNENGDKLGSIDYLVIDKRSGQVRYAALEFGGFLGMRALDEAAGECGAGGCPCRNRAHAR